jgi:hypothetical protein
MKNLSLALLAALTLFSVGCKKDNSTTNNNNNNTPTNPYYFTFTFNDTAYTYNYNQPEYMALYANEAGGFQCANASLSPSAGVGFYWKKKDTVTEADLMALVGKTLYFNDTTVGLSVSYERNGNIAEWDAMDTANTNYYVKVDSITYLKNDQELSAKVRTYIMKGSCNALLQNVNGPGIIPFTNGTFRIIIARQDL